MIDEYSKTRTIVRFIEERKLLPLLTRKFGRTMEVYYTFVNDENTLISCVYVKVNFDGYDAVLSVVWPLRVNYKKYSNSQESFRSFGKVRWKNHWEQATYWLLKWRESDFDQQKQKGLFSAAYWWSKTSRMIWWHLRLSLVLERLKKCFL